MTQPNDNTTPAFLQTPDVQSDTSQAPAAPPAPPASQQVPAAQPVPPQQAKPHPLARALDAVLKSATGGDVYYTDPDTGERKIAPQSRGTLGKTLIAATLAGMLAPDKYRETPYGPVRDFSGSATNAFEQSDAVMQRARNKPQQLSDEQQAAKLRVIENNSKQLALNVAQWKFGQAQFEVNKPTIDATNGALQEYEDNRDASDKNQPKAWLAQGQTADQIFQGGHKLTDSNVYQDGRTPDGQATYAVINPALQNITLSKDQTDLLAEINSSYRNIHAVVGGKVTVPMSTFISGMHDLAMVNSGLDWINDLNQNEGVNGGDAKEISPEDYKKALRANPQMLKAMWALTHKTAAGFLPDQHPDELLKSLATTPGGQGVLDLMHLSPEQASEKAEAIGNKRLAAQTLAKYGYTDKSPTDPAQIDALNAQIAQAPPEVQNIMAPYMADPHPTKGQFAKAEKAFQTAMQQDKTLKLREGDPKTMQSSVANVIMGDTSDVKDLLSARNNVRDTYNNMLQDEAARLGLDRSRYTLSAQKARNDKYQDYSSDDKNKVGGQLAGFSRMLGHFNESWEANQDWSRSNSPLLNKPIKWLDKNAMNDQDYSRFQASIIAPAKEYMNLLNQNRAEHEGDIQALSAVLNSDATPAQVMTALRVFAQTADVQVAALGRRYLETVGNTYPVVDGTGIGILENILGKGKSQAAKIAQPIPRGWQQANGQLQATPLTDPRLIQQIMTDAGGDYHKATRIARENGWAVPDPTR